jgi:hypothetical protein
LETLPLLAVVGAQPTPQIHLVCLVALAVVAMLALAVMVLLDKEMLAQVLAL